MIEQMLQHNFAIFHPLNSFKCQDNEIIFVNWIKFYIKVNVWAKWVSPALVYCQPFHIEITLCELRNSGIPIYFIREDIES